MSTVTAPAAATAPRTPGETVLWAWDVYRASQQAPWTPGRMGAQSRLMRLIDAHARTGHCCWKYCDCDPVAITVAALDLAALLPADGRES